MNRHQVYIRIGLFGNEINNLIVAKTDLSKLSASEYKGYYTDYLGYLVRNTFDANDRLTFVTYQPSELTLSANEVIEHTKYLFGDLPYVEVIEQTYVNSSLLKCGHLVDGYHSHLLIKESDYLTIKNKIDSLNLNILDKFTYNLDGLINRYFIKQAGTSRQRILPIKNIPTTQPKPTETITTLVTVKRIVKLIASLALVLHNVLDKYKTQKRFINKIDVKHRFVDDT